MPDNNNIHLRAEVIIEEGKKEEYKKLIQDMSRAVEANEPDTINYRFILMNLKLSVSYGKRMQIQRQYLFTLTVLHLKQYFQRFIVSLE